LFYKLFSVFILLVSGRRPDYRDVTALNLFYNTFSVDEKTCSFQTMTKKEFSINN